MLIVCLAAASATYLFVRSDEEKAVSYSFASAESTAAGSAAAGSAPAEPTAGGALGGPTRTQGAEAPGAEAPGEHAVDVAESFIEVRTEPSDAHVSTSGVILGYTPFELPRPPAGEVQELELHLAGYERVSLTIGHDAEPVLLRRLSLRRRATRQRPRRSDATMEAASEGAESPRRVGRPGQRRTTTGRATDGRDRAGSDQAGPSPMRRNRMITTEVVNPWD